MRLARTTIAHWLSSLDDVVTCDWPFDWALKNEAAGRGFSATEWTRFGTMLTSASHPLVVEVGIQIPLIQSVKSARSNRDKIIYPAISAALISLDDELLSRESFCELLAAEEELDSLSEFDGALEGSWDGMPEGALEGSWLEASWVGA